MPKKVVKRTAKSAKKTVKKAKKTAVKGGHRSGAGRPKGTGKFGCVTKAVRVPAHLVDEVQAFALKRMQTKKK